MLLVFTKCFTVLFYRSVQKKHTHTRIYNLTLTCAGIIQRTKYWTYRPGIKSLRGQGHFSNFAKGVLSAGDRPYKTLHTMVTHLCNVWFCDIISIPVPMISNGYLSPQYKVRKSPGHDLEP